ncbi:hypothetical protein MMC32_004397, partial [Xylographa parallela]|nr:hypothetical protein [Xylographa parallela]
MARRLVGILCNSDTSWIPVNFQLEKDHAAAVNYLTFSTPTKARVHIIQIDKPSNMVLAALRILDPLHSERRGVATKTFNRSSQLEETEAEETEAEEAEDEEV